MFENHNDKRKSALADFETAKLEKMIQNIDKNLTKEDQI